MVNLKFKPLDPHTDQVSCENFRTSTIVHPSSGTQKFVHTFFADFFGLYNTDICFRMVAFVEQNQKGDFLMHSPENRFNPWIPKVSNVTKHITSWG